MAQRASVFSLAEACAREGANIVIAETRKERLDEAVAHLQTQGFQALPFICDVTDLQQVEALADFAFAAFGDVALVINNAGVAQASATVMDTPMEELHRVFDVNFFGVWHGCRVFGQRLAAQGLRAAIYNTASENSYFVALPHAAAYVASKHAVHGLTDALRDELPEYVTVGMITPGFVGTEIVPEPQRGLGMPVSEFAAVALAQIRNCAFYVVTHGYNQVRINDRYQEISAAFTTYAPRQEGDECYDVRTLLARNSA